MKLKNTVHETEYVCVRLHCTEYTKPNYTKWEIEWIWHRDIVEPQTHLKRVVFSLNNNNNGIEHIDQWCWRNVCHHKARHTASVCMQNEQQSTMNIEVIYIYIVHVHMYAVKWVRVKRIRQAHKPCSDSIFDNNVYRSWWRWWWWNCWEWVKPLESNNEIETCTCPDKYRPIPVHILSVEPKLKPSHGSTRTTTAIVTGPFDIHFLFTLFLSISTDKCPYSMFDS